ncbi:LOW QUALITY PROTEIN: hypothetical protein CVT25_014471 [Psilocybe cyanescens]|uniref:Uncharacterized protein n=1 Tax=Psilocybe cyanescens TaxID=93625 RepID=A0A409XRA5_PSICY|nr:LOW QUALITY PROTEIN: hypothetical protein CVT25_014471 [Psilocybe cyanescens]
MVKFASALLFAALIAAPVFASGNWDDLNSRDLSEQDIFGRELTETEAVYAREVDELFSRIAEDLESRGVEYADLSERSKIGRKIGNFFKKIWHGIKKVASVVLKREDGEEEIRDLSEQSLFFGRDLANTDTDIVFARETDELFSRVAEELDARDIDVQDLSERSKIGRFFKKMWHGIKKVASVSPAPPKQCYSCANCFMCLGQRKTARDRYDFEVQDLSERSKIGRFFKKIWHGIKKVASYLLSNATAVLIALCASTSVIRREDEEDELLARSAELDLDELFERYIEEIDERSPGFGSFMKNGMYVSQIYPLPSSPPCPLYLSTSETKTDHPLPLGPTSSTRRTKTTTTITQSPTPSSPTLHNQTAAKPTASSSAMPSEREYEDEHIFGQEFEFDFDEHDFNELDELD